MSRSNRTTDAEHKFMLVIGNGNSARHLAKLGFARIPPHIDTFGMGLAYRLFESLNWWPTFYACCDIKVVHSNRLDFARLVDDPTVTSRRFYLPLEVSQSPKLELIPHSSTGDFCVEQSIRLGYRHILYVGMDRDYQEVIPEARPLTEREYVQLGYADLLSGLDPRKVGRDLLIVDREPVINTNYFFDSYQKKGDVYSVPKAATSHRRAWEKLNAVVESSDVCVKDLGKSVSNCSVTLEDLFELSSERLEERLRRSSPKFHKALRRMFWKS